MIMKWIGGGGAQLGEGGDEQRMRAIFAASVGQGTGGLGQGVAEAAKNLSSGKGESDDFEGAPGGGPEGSSKELKGSGSDSDSSSSSSESPGSNTSSGSGDDQANDKESSGDSQAMGESKERGDNKNGEL